MIKTPPPATTGQQVAGADSQPGDQVIYWIAGSWGSPMTKQTALYVRCTGKMCEIMIEATGRKKRVRLTSIGKYPTTQPVSP